MNLSHRIGIALGLLLLLPSAASAETLDVKTGQWESTTTLETSGAPPIDLSQLPPERRARIEAALKKQAAEGPHKHTRVTRGCLTQEELAKQPFEGMGSALQKDGESCKTTTLSATRRRWRGRISCAGMVTLAGEVTIDALSREKVTGEVTTRAANDARAMTSHMTISARWLGATCEKK